MIFLTGLSVRPLSISSLRPYSPTASSLGTALSPLTFHTPSPAHRAWQETNKPEDWHALGHHDCIQVIQIIIYKNETQCSHPVKFDDRGDMTGLRGAEREREGGRAMTPATKQEKYSSSLPLSLRLMEDLTPAWKKEKEREGRCHCHCRAPQQHVPWGFGSPPLLFIIFLGQGWKSQDRKIERPEKEGTQ